MGLVKRISLLGAGGALIIYGFLGCSGGSHRPEPKVECSTLFLAPDHQAQSGCLGALFPGFDISDSVIFYDKTSKIRVLPPRLPHSEPYHCHLYQRHQGGTLS